MIRGEIEWWCGVFNILTKIQKVSYVFYTGNDFTTETDSKNQIIRFLSGAFNVLQLVRESIHTEF